MLQFDITGEDIKGFAVDSVEAGMIGCYRDGKPYRPNNEAVRAALPYRYRRAFDRAHGAWWFNGDSAHVALRGYRGNYMVTLYANPKA